MDTAVILASGGIGSTVAAAWAARDAAVNLLHIDYDQPAAARQRAAVEALAAALPAERILTINLTHLTELDDAGRTARRESPAASEKSPAVPAAPPGIMPTLLLAGVQWAFRVGASRVVCGASQVADEIEGEALPGEGRPDHRTEFFHAFNIMLESASPPRRKIAVEAPLVDMTRVEIIRLGTRFQAPFQLTWVCHRGLDVPCGECPQCQWTSKAFTTAGIADPAIADRPRMKALTPSYETSRHPR